MPAVRKTCGCGRTAFYRVTRMGDGSIHVRTAGSRSAARYCKACAEARRDVLAGVCGYPGCDRPAVTPGGRCGRHGTSGGIGGRN